MIAPDFERLWVRDTLLVVEFSQEKLGILPLGLWAARDGKDSNQVWVLEECESRFGEVWRLGLARLTRLF
jgi:hypothetical protein